MFATVYERDEVISQIICLLPYSEKKNYSDFQKVHNTHRAVEKLRIKSESIKVTGKINKQLVQQLGLGFLATRAKKGTELIVIWFC